MADIKSETKPTRTPGGPRARTRPRAADPAPLAVEEDTFGAGIIDEPAKTAPPVPSSDATPAKAEPDGPPPAAGRIDPNESGFDAETNSRYEEIKRGSTFITQLQQMTLAQLQKAAKDDVIPREEWAGLK